MVKKLKGFALLSPERRRSVASRGGIMAHKLGTAHKFTSAEAKAAGKLGGRGKRSIV